VKDVVSDNNQDFSVRSLEKLYGRTRGSDNKFTFLAIGIAVIGVIVGVAFMTGRH
jgi:hypothetical protein